MTFLSSDVPWEMQQSSVPAGKPQQSGTVKGGHSNPKPVAHGMKHPKSSTPSSPKASRKK